MSRVVAAIAVAARFHSRFNGVAQNARSRDDVAVARLFTALAADFDVPESVLVVGGFVSVAFDETCSAFPRRKTVVGESLLLALSRGNLSAGRAVSETRHSRQVGGASTGRRHSRFERDGGDG